MFCCLPTLSSYNFRTHTIRDPKYHIGICFQCHLYEIRMSEDTIVVGNLRIPEQHFVNMIFDEDSENIEKREGLINHSHLIIYTKTIVE